MEFIVDEKRHFYFLEVNSRIQVEHPVTEMVTGIDIVKEQIRIAAGEELSFSQKDVKIHGHAIECRINAEDPFNNFCPCPGKIVDYHPPSAPWIRVDTYIHSLYTIPQYYDSLIAKLIAWGRNRDEAILRMMNALDEFKLVGIKSTVPYHRIILKDEQFRKGNIHTRFIEEQISTKEIYKRLQSEEIELGYHFEDEAKIAVLASAVACYLRTRNSKDSKNAVN
jgi:acetyl-CoA carboxylase biotin carboxylase subunit